MIRNFSDHAANERTFLAWVRTALAVMAFGFLVEKFDLFIRLYAAKEKPAGGLAGSGGFADLAGLALMGFGALAIFVALARFRLHARQIDDREERTWHGGVAEILLSFLLIGLCAGVGIYLVHLAVR